MDELRHNLEKLLQRWVVLAITVVLGAGAGMLYAALTPPAYTTSAIVVVAQEEPGDGDGRDVSYAQAFGRLIGQQDITSRAGQATGFTADEVVAAVRATTSPDAPMIEVSGTAADPVRAADLVNAVAAELIRTASSSQADTGVRLFVLSPALAPVQSSSPDTVVGVAVGAAAGFLLGGLFVLASGGRPAGGGPVEQGRTGPEGARPGPNGPSPAVRPAGRPGSSRGQGTPAATPPMNAGILPARGARGGGVANSSVSNGSDHW